MFQVISRVSKLPHILLKIKMLLTFFPEINSPADSRQGRIAGNLLPENWTIHQNLDIDLVMTLADFLAYSQIYWLHGISQYLLMKLGC